MADKPLKISIGFLGGQSLALRVSSEELGKLRQALSASGWHEVVAEDGTITLDLTKVVYVLSDTEEHRVGFGA
jgi:hypothetical protein